MPETFTRWDAANYLKTEEDARLYLASCAEEDPGDGSLIRLARADVARAASRINQENDHTMSLPTVFVNLVVEDVAKTREFFAALGFEFDPMCSGDQTVCVILAEGVRAMLMDSAFFQAFTSKTVADARESTEAVIALDVGGRERVDDILARATAAGGRESREPRDHGFMYGRGFEDPDGHLWEVYHMSGGSD